jgi:C-terminal processing protease CtpA/Prc
MKLSFNCFVIAFLFAVAVRGQSVPCAIGALIAITPRAEGDRLQILDVTSNFPAAQAGLAAAQVISAIDGVPTMGLRIADCLRRIQGKAGTKVVLEIED